MATLVGVGSRGAPVCEHASRSARSGNSIRRVSSLRFRYIRFHDANQFRVGILNVFEPARSDPFDANSSTSIAEFAARLSYARWSCGFISGGFSVPRGSACQRDNVRLRCPEGRLLARAEVLYCYAYCSTALCNVNADFVQRAVEPVDSDCDSLQNSS